LITGLFLLTASCRGQEQAVSIGPGVFPFPEIARKLSVNGRIVVCPVALRNRAAVVSLKNRTWKQVTELLGAGLDLRIRQTDIKQNLWILERDPAVLAREEPWLMHLAEELRKSAIKAAEEQAIPPDETYGDTIRRFIKVSRKLLDAQKQDPEGAKPETAALTEEMEQLALNLALHNWYGAKVAQTLTVPSILAAIKNRTTFQAIDLARHYDAQAMRDLLAFSRQQKEEEKAIALAKGEKPEEEGDEPSEEDLKRLASGDWTGSIRLRFNPQHFALDAQMIEILGGKPQIDSCMPGSDDHPPDDPTLPNLLGSSFVSWYAKEQNSTNSFLKSDRAELPFSLPNHSGWPALSEILESYAVKNDAEVILELYPPRELLNPSRISGASQHSAPSNTLAKLLESKALGADDWSFMAQDGVVIARNRMACIDRYHDYRLAALLVLEKSYNNKPDNYRRVHSLRFSSLLAFHRSITAEENAALTEIGEYRGLDVTAIATSRPIVLLLAHYSSIAINRALASTAGLKRVDIPLDDIPETVLQQAMLSLRELAINDSDSTARFPNESLLNGFTSLLRGWQIRIQETSSGKHPYKTFSLLHVMDNEPDGESSYANSELGELLFL
jgi:hypothetical protein